MSHDTKTDTSHAGSIPGMNSEARATLMYLFDNTRRSYLPEEGITRLQFNPPQEYARHALQGLLRNINVALGTDFKVKTDKPSLVVRDVDYGDGKLSLDTLISQAYQTPNNTVSEVESLIGNYRNQRNEDPSATLNGISSSSFRH